MIRLRVVGRFAVPLYRQIEQAAQALRMGVLSVYDQLPGIREVVTVIAVNPSTVLKAYRDLEREGLVEARAGPLPGQAAIGVRGEGPPMDTGTGEAPEKPCNSRTTLRTLTARVNQSLVSGVLHMPGVAGTWPLLNTILGIG